MKFLIVIPRFIDRLGDYYDFPLGLAIISAVLKRDGHAVEVLNLNHCFTEDVGEQLRQAIDERGAGVVCCGGLSAHYHAIMDVVNGARGAEKDVTLILGGGIISSEPELMTAELDADYAVIGEGELTMADLARALSAGEDATQLLGTLHKTASGRVIRNAPRPNIEDLNYVPFPDYEGFGVDDYLSFQRPSDNVYMNVQDEPRLLPVILSRSCPYQCTFCFHPLGNKYRRSSLDNFFDQVDVLVKKYKINMLAVLDELFSLNKENMIEFCERMKPYNLKWIAQLRVDQVSREMLEMLKDCGLFYISYGLESTSEVVLKSMKKHITAKQIEDALALSREIGIGIQGNFIFGDPAETLVTARETIDWWEKHYFYHINLTALIPYPGSQVYDYCLEQGLIQDKMEFVKKGCPSLNMTALNNIDYGTIYAEARDAQAKNRQFAKNISAVQTGHDSYKAAHAYSLTMTCPHCDTVNVYNNFSCNELGAFKIVCRHCHQRSDVPSSYFEHLNTRWKPVAAALKKIVDSSAPVSLTPVGDVLNFNDGLLALGIDVDSLNLQYVLDYDVNKEGQTLMNLPVLHRSPKNLAEKCKGHSFLILPCENHQRIYEELLRCGVEKGRIVSFVSPEAYEPERP